MPTPAASRASYKNGPPACDVQRERIMMPETKAFRANKATAAAWMAVCLIIAFMAMQAQASDSAALMEKQLFDLGFQAITVSDDSSCVIELVWIDVEALLIANGLPPQPLAIYRSDLSYPGEDGSSGELIFSGSTSQKGFTDSSVVFGVEYYYTLTVGVYGTLYFLSDTTTGSCTGTTLNLRATPTQDNDGNCYITLTWLPIGEPVALYRSVQGYPLQSGDLDSVILEVFDGFASSYNDDQIFEGEQYFYTLIAGDNIREPEGIDRATAVACGDVMPVYTEVFNENNPYDLVFTQAVFRPVQEDPPYLDDDLSDMTIDDYEVTLITEGIRALPVAKSDSGGHATQLSLHKDVIFPIQLAHENSAFSFPFFGKRYGLLRLSANGYIALGAGVEKDSFNETMMLEDHFSEPRIAFFNTELSPELGGEVWLRIFDDSIVFTFEKVPVQSKQPTLNPDRVTVQVELFYSGHIRMTWLEGDMTNGLIGISDGRGVPQEPSDILPTLGLSGAYRWMPFLSLANQPQRISLLPLPWPVVAPASTIAFTAEVEKPSFLSGTPLLHALWSGPGAAPFTDLGDGVGYFNWRPDVTESGFYLLRIVAILGEERVFQDLIINVRPADALIFLPNAVELEITSRTGGADPREDHAAMAGDPLYASYVYDHPLAQKYPELFAEGNSIVYWFKNGQIIPAFTNRSSVPTNVTQPGDVWYFTVLPVNVSGVAGPTTTSAAVTIVSVPVITSIEPAQGTSLGGDRVVIRGQYLAFPKKVTFGGIAATQITFVGDGHIEVITPPHAPGRVAVMVETVAGAAAKNNAFRYLFDGEEVEDEKQKNIFGCGPAADGTGSRLLVDFFPAIALLGLLAFRSRKESAKVS